MEFYPRPCGVEAGGGVVLMWTCGPGSSYLHYYLKIYCSRSFFPVEQGCLVRGCFHHVAPRGGGQRGSGFGKTDISG